MKTTQFEFKTLQEIASDAIDKLNGGIGLDCYGCDLHNELFNTDYYIIGRYQAEQWLIANTGVFNGIGIVRDYEIDNFGQISTDLAEPENIVNMLVYIAGEEVLMASDLINQKWNERLNQDDIDQIIHDIKEEYNL